MLPPLKSYNMHLYQAKNRAALQTHAKQFALKAFNTVLFLFNVGISFANNIFILFFTLTLVMLKLQSFYLSNSSFKIIFFKTLLLSSPSALLLL